MKTIKVLVELRPKALEKVKKAQHELKKELKKANKSEAVNYLLEK